MTYARDAINNKFSDFDIDPETVYDVDNTVDFIKSMMILENGVNEDNFLMAMNTTMQSMGHNNSVQENPYEREVEYQIVCNYFLLRAVHSNSIWEVRESIKRGAKVNEFSLYRQRRSLPVIEAARLGNTLIVTELIKAGADINITKSNGESAIAMAADNNDLEMAKLLLNNGANPNPIAHHGITALAQAESPEMIELLLKHGADPNIPDIDGDLPIVARISNRDLASTLALYRGGTDINRKNNSGISARDYFRQYFGFDLDD